MNKNWLLNGPPGNPGGSGWVEQPCDAWGLLHRSTLERRGGEKEALLGTAFHFSLFVMWKQSPPEKKQ